MVQKISIHDVKVSWLNVRCLTLISKYVRIVHDQEDLVINLRDRDVLQQVMEHARHTSDVVLSRLFLNLRAELQTNLSEDSVAAIIAAETVPVTLSGRPANNAARFLRF